jgi:hypothetical protein
MVAIGIEELEDHKKRGAKLKHCITSTSKQCSGKFSKHNLKYL